MRKFGKKITLSILTLKKVHVAEGAAETDPCSCVHTCSPFACGWDSDVVKFREGGGGKESK